MKNKYCKRSHVSEAKFRTILRCFGEDVPALDAAAICGVNRHTTQRIYTLLRERVVAWALDEAKPLLGEIEVDESYFGPRRVRGKRGRGASGKIPVLGLHKRQSQVIVSIVPNCSRKSLMPIIQGKVLEESDVFTDGWRAYDGLVTQGYRHHRVHHHRNEFVRGRSHVNGIESFWSFAKRRFAKLKGVKKECFLTHLKECEWRWNHRRDKLYQMLLKELRRNPL